MHDLNTSYTVYFNRKHSHTGPVLQGRYKAILVEKEPYFLELTRYIHLNPIRAKMVSRVEKYEWSSYPVYSGMKEEAWVNCQWARERFGKNWREKYQEFVEEGIDSPSPLRNLKAGLLLGSQQFLSQVKERISGRKVPREIPSWKEWKRVTLDDVIQHTADFFNIDEREIVSKRREFLPRKIALYLSRRCTFERLGSIGERFGISYLGVSKAVSRMEEEMRRETKVRDYVEEIQRKL